MENLQLNQIYATILRFSDEIDTELAWETANVIYNLNERTLELIIANLNNIWHQTNLSEGSIITLGEKIFLMLQPRKKFSDLYNSRELHPSNEE